MVFGITIGAGNFSGPNHQNVAFGTGAFSKNTAGWWGVAIGNNTLSNNTTGTYNTGVGGSTLNLNSTGSYNVALGSSALSLNISGDNNNAIGFSSLSSNTTGKQNIAVGTYALANNVSGDNNVAIGYNALKASTGGSGNIVIGTGSILTNTNVNNVIALGGSIGVTDGISNSIAIGTSALLTASNTVQLGGTGITDVYAGPAGTAKVYGSQFTSTSDKRLKTNIKPFTSGIKTIMELNPVHYNKKRTLDSKIYDITEDGFIAQEIQKVLPYVVSEDNSKDKMLSVNYTSLIPILTKAIQEQQKEILEQQKVKAIQDLKIKTMQNEQDALKKRLDLLESLFKTKKH
jgi:hypothetical protein